MTDVAVAVECGCTLGESPVWDVAARRLWWVDILRGRVHAFDPHSGETRHWGLPERVSAVAPAVSGGLVLALASGFARWDPATDALRRVASPEAHLPDNRFNDGRCDRAGRFWAGTMHDRAAGHSGALYRLDPDQSCHRMAEQVGISNGIAWSPDDRVFYFADTLRRLIYAYDFEAAHGTLGHRRVFADMTGQPGSPDGSTVDAEGFLWNAQWGGGRLVRYAPDGRIDRVVPLPVSQPTSCMFGGPDLRTLYVTSASIGLNPMEPLAGHVLALDAGVQGLPETPFAG